MLELIIDAYKEKTKDKNFFETVKKLDIISKIFLGIFVLDIIMLIIFLILGKFKMALGFIGGFIMFTRMAKFVLGILMLVVVIMAFVVAIGMDAGFWGFVLTLLLGSVLL